MRKRRQFTPEFKARVVLDILSDVRSQAEASRKHNLGPKPSDPAPGARGISFVGKGCIWESFTAR